MPPSPHTSVPQQQGSKCNSGLQLKKLQDTDPLRGLIRREEKKVNRRGKKQGNQRNLKTMTPIGTRSNTQRHTPSQINITSSH